MKTLLKPHPAIVAFLLTGGAFIIFVASYLLRFPEYVVNRSGTNADLILALLWTFFAVGVLMWMIGGVIFGKRCGLGWLMSLFLHFLPLLGLILMRVMAKRRISRGLWALRYRGVEDRVSKRTWREMKALY
jgi:hypothetical protein